MEKLEKIVTQKKANCRGNNSVTSNYFASANLTKLTVAKASNASEPCAY